MLIGIYIDSSADGVIRTLQSIYENSLYAENNTYLGIILLIDDASVISELAPLDLPKIILPPASGKAAAFNQLVLFKKSDIYLLLENGVWLAPDCLARLQYALQSQPNGGIAGPSTNRCWNEQMVAPIARQVPADSQQRENIYKTADQIAMTYGADCRRLAPLYSVADFCYAVSSETVAAVGAADENYGAGPCWEMDYNIRAARAGFAGLWVCGAYAARSPLTQDQIAQELKLSLRNRQRYQSKFCERQAYTEESFCNHCLGDECGHFALASLIQIPMNFPEPIAPLAALPHSVFAECWHLGVTGKEITPKEISLSENCPLVSCVMPTRGRAEFVTQSIEYFKRQTYPNAELIIVYEQQSDVPCIEFANNIIFLQAATYTSIGEKRNQAVALAKGEIIAQWDDDDWYAPERLWRQVLPIVQQSADITGLNNFLFLHLAEEDYWQLSPALFRQLFYENVAGGTLVYRKTLWDLGARYPTTSLREDAEFLQSCLHRNARLARINGAHLFVYIRHPNNTWKFSEGTYGGEQGWSRVDCPLFLTNDRYFYQSFKPKHHAAKCLEQRHIDQQNHVDSYHTREPIQKNRTTIDDVFELSMPFISCIMPTANRAQFIEQAIRNFTCQEYPLKELIIIDDGAESIEKLIPSADNIRYYRVLSKQTLGEKRNRACELAKGDLIAHWDDDDWMSPNWLSSQVNTLKTQDADICGLKSLLFYHSAARQAWRYTYGGRQAWVAGGTLCYTKAFWQRNKFLNINIGEDNAFLWSATPKKIAINSAIQNYVARIHSHNTSPKITQDSQWQPVDLGEIENLFHCIGESCVDA